MPTHPLINNPFPISNISWSNPSMYIWHYLPADGAAEKRYCAVVKAFQLRSTFLQGKDSSLKKEARSNDKGRKRD